MKSLMGFSVVAAMALGLSGCASTGASTLTSFAAANSGHRLAAAPVPQDPNPRGGLFSSSEMRVIGDPDGHGGIPTPEPAAPQRDLQLAGPTPQIPIPGGGYAGIPAN